MDKKKLSERDICTKFITPAIEQAGWQQLKTKMAKGWIAELEKTQAIERTSLPDIAEVA
ncbi:MAG: hypothetical protein RBT11_07855 [Desulfobacterales bacterium]|jgi:type I site-specific restriction endonuclease|nr:hypothetical protein [Desulfobacterales bacterium]